MSVNAVKMEASGNEIYRSTIKNFDLKVIPFFIIGINTMSKESQGGTFIFTVFLSGL